MAETELKININAKDNTGAAARKAKMNLQELGDKIGGIGRTMTAAFTLPIAGAFAAAVANSEELQEALQPLKDTAVELSSRFGDALAPAIERVVEKIVPFIERVADLADAFADLPPGTQDIILGVVAAFAAIGPILVTIGTFVSTVGRVNAVLTTLGGLGSVATTISTIGASLGTMATLAAPVIALAGALVLLWQVLNKFGPDALNTLKMITLLALRPIIGDAAFLSLANSWGYNVGAGATSGTNSFAPVNLGIGVPVNSYTNPELSTRGSGVNRGTGSKTTFGRANGGSAFRGMPLMVGERGRELFVPRTDGNIIPNNRLGGGGTNIFLSYSPIVSLADQREAETKLLPFMTAALRKAGVA